MTDTIAIHHALSALNAVKATHVALNRNGRLFMLLPSDRKAALHTLSLYQPQRLKAKVAIFLVKILVLLGLHQLFLPQWSAGNAELAIDPLFVGVDHKSVGIMLGSPEHSVRRAILTYQCQGKQEVAKIAFGAEGREVISAEAAVLRDLPERWQAIPRLIDCYATPACSLLRMPFEKGEPISSGEVTEVLKLLDSWMSADLAIRADSFPEWNEILSALEETEEGRLALEALSKQMLVPTLRHGDFARWNLLRKSDRSLVVLDWEWGKANSMPGLDLVHFFLQEERLVNQLTHEQAMVATIAKLGLESCENYMSRGGWRGSMILPLIASLAWKQGAGHQDNHKILQESLELFKNCQSTTYPQLIDHVIP
jgi:hypothetical protein